MKRQWGGYGPYGPSYTKYTVKSPLFPFAKLKVKTYNNPGMGGFGGGGFGHPGGFGYPGMMGHHPYDYYHHSYGYGWHG